jgi:hypothetical protein
MVDLGARQPTFKSGSFRKRPLPTIFFARRPPASAMPFRWKNERS